MQLSVQNSYLIGNCWEYTICASLSASMCVCVSVYAYARPIQVKVVRVSGNNNIQQPSSSSVISFGEWKLFHISSLFNLHAYTSFICECVSVCACQRVWFYISIYIYSNYAVSDRTRHQNPLQIKERTDNEWNGTTKRSWETRHSAVSVCCLAKSTLSFEKATL